MQYIEFNYQIYLFRFVLVRMQSVWKCWIPDLKEEHPLINEQNEFQPSLDLKRNVNTFQSNYRTLKTLTPFNELIDLEP